MALKSMTVELECLSTYTCNLFHLCLSLLSKGACLRLDAPFGLKSQLALIATVFSLCFMSLALSLLELSGSYDIYLRLQFGHFGGKKTEGSLKTRFKSGTRSQWIPHVWSGGNMFQIARLPRLHCGMQLSWWGPCFL